MDAIKKIATGVVRFEQTEDGLLLHRFSEKQTEAFYQSLPYYTGEYFNGYFALFCQGCIFRRFSRAQTRGY